MSLTHEANGQNAQGQHRPHDNFIFHPKEWTLVEQNVAQGTTAKSCQKNPTTQTPTTSMRLRAASIIPDNANAKVASNSMLSNNVESQVAKLSMMGLL
jgi:hypothetical protein